MNKKLRFLGITFFLLIFCCCNFSALAKVSLTETLTAQILSYKYWNTNLSYDERVADLLSHMTISEKCAEFLSHGMPAIPRLGVAEYWWPGEANHGIANLTLWYKDVSDPVSTVFPNTMGQGSTWNPELIRNMASMIGDEARAYYQESKKGLSYWAPTINMGRDPRWGRVDEYFGEDPYLVAQMGSAYVDGFQNDSCSKYLKALATIKHLVANSTENDRFYSSSDVDARDLREFYGNQFEQIIKNTNPSGIMTSYNAVNGTPCAVNKTMMIDIARETWGFSGFYISDKGAIKNLYGYTKANTKNPDQYWTSYTCNSLAQAVSDPMKAGLNLELENPTNVWQTNTQIALNQGLITEDDIDKALFYLFLVRFKTGEFDRNSTDYSNIPTVAEQVYTNPAHQNAAIAVAEQATVLLENNGILPLKANQTNSLVVVGQNADQVYNGPYSSSQTAKKKTIEISPYTAIKSKYFAANPSGTIELISPSTDADGKFALTSDQLTKIKAAGTVIVLVNTWSSSPGGSTSDSDFGEFKDRTTLDLPRGQAAMTNQIATTNANTVVYMMTGGQVNVNSFNKKVAALLWCCYNGQGQGPACANLLFGTANPSGRLTMTWYANESQLGNLYGNFAIRSSSSSFGKTYMYFTGDVTYPFGFGLSYSTFKFGKVTLDKISNVTGDDKIVATVKVQNTSAVDGYEVVQFYVSSPAGYVERPAQRLAGFSKVWIPAGQTKTVNISLDVSNLHFWNKDKDCFDFDLGTYTVKLGDSSKNIVTTSTFNLTKGQKLAVKIVTATPNRVVINAKGETIKTVLSVAMNNDHLYSKIGDIPSILGVKVLYSSSNPKVAKVSNNGIVTAVGEGVATIKVTVFMNGGATTGSYPVAVNYGD
jgi:beta-glucosidase